MMEMVVLGVVCFAVGLLIGWFWRALIAYEDYENMVRWNREIHKRKGEKHV